MARTQNRTALDFKGAYDVFLSFRGTDTRHGFTDHLYHNLVGAGVDSFRDDNELRVGEEIGPELFKAIRDSKISVPIFSKNYAESKWCLREFALMVECKEKWGQKIIPIFYDVEPFEIQHYGRGSYADAFFKYENDSSLDQSIVDEWKKALAIVGELKGLELKKETNGLEGAFVKIVVQKILLELKKNDVHLPKTLVGVDNHIEKLKRLSNNESNGVRIIGILGMSGIGKTTIAKAIYNELNESFDSSCFLEDVGGVSKGHNGILHLQSLLTSRIFFNWKALEFSNTDEGTRKIKDGIYAKKVFLVLDNVTDKFQIEKLAVNHSFYGAGSRIILTTTNEEILLEVKLQCERDGKFDVYENYEHQLMGDEDALKLFSDCAFKRNSPPHDYLELSKEVVSHAGGLPLVLETLGSSLSIEKDKASWEEKLRKLREIPPREVSGRLRISYDALDFGQKQIFLDIACFFVGHGRSNPVYMWDACGFHASEGIRALIHRSLIKFREDDKEDDTEDSSDHYTVANKSKADDDIFWMHDQLRELGKQIVKENINDPWERSRVWDDNGSLELEGRHPEFKNLEALCLNKFIHRDVSMSLKLRYLSANDIELVKDFPGVLSNLRWIRLRGCGTAKLITSKIYLKNLLVLDLSGCEIDHTGRFWKAIKMTEKLKVLNLSHCINLWNVSRLSSFVYLERLDLRSCLHLVKLDGLKKLVSMTYLNLSYCDLETLDLSEMRKLCWLDIRGCSRITEVQGLESLVSLQYMNVSHLYCLQKLPCLSNLQTLTRFNASHCSNLTETRGLDELRSLEHFNMSSCGSLRIFPDVSNFKKLVSLKTRFNRESEIQGLAELESLEYLEIYNTEFLWRIPDLPGLKRLRELSIASCKNLTEIQGLHVLESLEAFNMFCCSSIESVSKFPDLKRLKVIRVSDCKKLSKICGLEGLESLVDLTVKNCISFENLDLSNHKNLWRIVVSGCRKLSKIQGLEQLASLTSLRINGCDSLDENLPTLPNTKIIRDWDS